MLSRTTCFTFSPSATICPASDRQTLVSAAWNSFRTDLNCTPLLLLATTRGRLLELIAQKTRPGNRHVADTAFTIGIMSLMDTLFSLPLNEILGKIAVVDEVSEALLQRTGLYGEMLKLAEYIEQIDDAGALLPPVLDKLQLSTEDLYDLQLAAFDWANDIADSAGQVE